MVEDEAKPANQRRRANPNLGAAAARIRERLKVSQVELGRRLDCSQQYVSKFERGLVPMTPSCVQRVADAFAPEEAVTARDIYLEARKISRHNQTVVQPNREVDLRIQPNGCEVDTTHK
jgi:predicted transcriptional regulator